MQMQNFLQTNQRKEIAAEVQRILILLRNKFPIIMGIDYKTAKEKELNKGLDLKGGINVILQVLFKTS